MKVFLSILCKVLTLILVLFTLCLVIGLWSEVLFGTPFAIFNAFFETFDLERDMTLMSIVGAAIFLQLIIEVRRPHYEAAPVKNNYGISGAGITAAQKAFPQRLKKIKKK